MVDQPKSHEHLMSMLLSNATNFLLSPFVYSNFDTINEIMKRFNASKIVMTKFISYFEQGNIAYKIKSGSNPMFQYFRCFSFEVWALMVCSLLVYSLFFTLQHNSFGKSPFVAILENMWNFLVVFVSHSTPKQFKSNETFKRILIIFWLYITMIYVILFSNYLIDYMVKVIPDIVIDSWLDLFMTKDVKIITMNSSPIQRFSILSNTDMAKDFSARLEPFPLEKIIDDEFFKSILLKILDGSHVYVFTRMTLIIHLKMIAKKLGNMDVLDQVYVSKEGGGYLPYFVPATFNTDERVLKSFDHL